MRFLQNHKGHYYAPFLGLKKHINGLNFWQKPKNPILEEFWGFFPKMKVFLKNAAPSVFKP